MNSKGAACCTYFPCPLSLPVKKTFGTPSTARPRPHHFLHLHLHLHRDRYLKTFQTKQPSVFESGIQGETTRITLHQIREHITPARRTIRLGGSCDPHALSRHAAAALLLHRFGLESGCFFFRTEFPAARNRHGETRFIPVTAAKPAKERPYGSKVQRKMDSKSFN